MLHAILVLLVMHWVCSYDYPCFDQGGKTALMIAAYYGYHECLSVLLAHGAAVDKANEVSVVATCIGPSCTVCHL